VMARQRRGANDAVANEKARPSIPPDHAEHRA
jgi:hypothetical protein